MSISSLLVMVCCFILTGGAVLASLNIKNSLKSISGENSLNVYLKKGISYEKVQEICEAIKNNPNIASCTYYSRDEAVLEYKEILGELFEAFQGDENPLPDTFHITMKDLSLYKRTVSSIEEIDGVSSISDRSETAKRLSLLDELVTNVGVFIVIALGAVSIFIISNTIKITLNGRKFEIYIMRCIGATDWFIRMPFLIEGVTIGFFASIISTLLLGATYNKMTAIIDSSIPFKIISFSSISLNVFTTFLLFGIFFGIIGGIFSINRYLKKEGADVAMW